jgi:hypothetical protein
LSSVEVMTTMGAPDSVAALTASSTVAKSLSLSSSKPPAWKKAAVQSARTR